ncbi:hypothetical protein CGZ93_17800 [Enemella dayhoffiae]|uniref:C2H2-type domain-containing protein n=1 Tax=Enemella dayhoffiae TaxID=2016507 RepID=A0A255GTY4_9ACTN|nr:hypothetical protein [Enemella dayhoffiae]OYO16614.1 hypothetical protein CGZ93_17800 [Enemella dayhoffiae]
MIPYICSGCGDRWWSESEFATHLCLCACQHLPEEHEDRPGHYPGACRACTCSAYIEEDR